MVAPKRRAQSEIKNCSDKRLHGRSMTLTWHLLGGFVGPYLIDWLNDRTHALTASFAFIALVYVAAASLILSLRIRDPLEGSQSSKSD
jgi:hypothetical protein